MFMSPSKFGLSACWFHHYHMHTFMLITSKKMRNMIFLVAHQIRVNHLVTKRRQNKAPMGLDLAMMGIILLDSQWKDLIQVQAVMKKINCSLILEIMKKKNLSLYFLHNLRMKKNFSLKVSKGLKILITRNKKSKKIKIQSFKIWVVCFLVRINNRSY